MNPKLKLMLTSLLSVMLGSYGVYYAVILGYGQTALTPFLATLGLPLDQIVSLMRKPSAVNK